MSAAAQALLAELRTLGVDVVATGDRIRYRPLGAVSLDLRDRLREHREPLLELLRGAPPPEVPRSAVLGSLKVQTVRVRLAALLEGRLWQDSDGWWPRDTGLSASHAARVTDAAMVAVPEEHPVPGPMTAARGAIAVRAWQQVVACVVAELGWSVDRAARVAALVVDPCFDLAAADREGQA